MLDPNAAAALLGGADEKFVVDGPMRATVTAAEFAAMAGMGDSVASAVAFCILARVRRMAHLVDVTVRFQSAGNPAADHNMLGLPAADAGDVYADDFSRRVVEFQRANRDRLARHTLVLLAGAQVKPLSEDNVENFFKSKGLDVAGRQVATVCNLTCAWVINLIAVPAVQQEAQNNAWLGYRVKVASGVGLMHVVASAWPAMFSNIDQAAINAANLQPWRLDLAYAISVGARAKCYIFHDVFDTLPKSWPMGVKAADTIAGPIRIRLVALFKRLKETIRDNAAVDNMNTDQVVAAIGGI